MQQIWASQIILNTKQIKSIQKNRQENYPMTTNHNGLADLKLMFKIKKIFEDHQILKKKQRISNQNQNQKKYNQMKITKLSVNMKSIVMMDKMNKNHQIL